MKLFLETFLPCTNSSFLGLFLVEWFRDGPTTAACAIAFAGSLVASAIVSR